MTITTVIFDYGGVLSVSPFGRLRATEERLGVAPGALQNALGYGLDVPEPAPGEPYTNPWHLLEIGAIDLEAYVTAVKARLAEVFGEHASRADEALAAGFSSMGIQWPMVHEVMRLRREGFHLAVCTNNIAAYRSAWEQQIPIELFEVVVDSSEVGVRKPDARIYELTCERLGVAPEECVFVDDHPANVVGAERVGMVGLLVESDDPRPAIAELRRLTSPSPSGASSTAER